MALMTTFQTASIKSGHTSNPEQTITATPRHLMNVDTSGDYDFNWDSEENKIEELESPESFDDIYVSLDMISETLSNVEDYGDFYNDAVEAIETFRACVEEGAEEEIISEDFFKDIFDEILEPYSEENSKARSEGVNSFDIYWESKRFLWFTVKLPVGFIIKLSASTCRQIISKGVDLAFDAIVCALDSYHFAAKLAITISLLAGLTGNAVLAAAAGILTTIASSTIVYFVVGYLLKEAFGYLVDKVLAYTIKNGIIVYTRGIVPIRFSFQ